MGRVPSFQVRFHGRGGQGAVTASELLSVAAFHEGRYAQAFPSFGSERMGAPVSAFCRIADRVIRTREPVVSPDAVIVLDATLLHSVEVFQGLRPDGWVLINSAREVEGLGLRELAAGLPKGHLCRVAATDLALTHIGRPVPNAVLLGGFVAMTHSVSLPALHRAIRARFQGDVATANIAAATAGHDSIDGGDRC